MNEGWLTDRISNRKVSDNTHTEGLRQKLLNKIGKGQNRASTTLLAPNIVKTANTTIGNNNLQPLPDGGVAYRSFNSSRVSLIVQEKIESLDSSLLLIKSKMQKMKSMSRKIKKNGSFLQLKCKTIRDSLVKFKGRCSIINRT